MLVLFDLIIKGLAAIDFACGVIWSLLLFDFVGLLYFGLYLLNG